MRGHINKDNSLNRINTQLRELDRFTEALVLIEDCSLEDFLADDELQRLAERNLHGALEAAMTTCSLLTVTAGHGLPNTYEGLFRQLAKEGIINNALADGLETLEEFHNILTHGKIKNWNIVYDQLSNQNYFRNFTRQVRSYLRRAA